MGRVGLADQFRAYGRRPMSSGSEAVSHLYLLDFTHPGTASISGWAGATPEPDSGARFSAGPPRATGAAAAVDAGDGGYTDDGHDQLDQ
jgi:hypothetical protein